MPAHNSIRWEGLDELRAALRRMPAAFAEEGAGIVLTSAQEAERDIDAAYQRHQRSGALRSGLDLVKSAAGRFGAGYMLINRASHAWLFEHGSQARHFTGTDAKGRRYIDGARGAMPATPTFIPIVMRKRREMYAQLAAMLRRAGLQVVGDAA